MEDLKTDMKKAMEMACANEATTKKTLRSVTSPEAMAAMLVSTLTEIVLNVSRQACMLQDLQQDPVRFRQEMVDIHQ